MSVTELGESPMVDAAKRLRGLSEAERSSQLHEWVKHSFEGQEAKQLMLTLAAEREWEALGATLTNPSVREHLWLIIDLVLRHAVDDESVNDIENGIPGPLQPREFDAAIAYAFRKLNTDLADLLVAKQAKPSLRLLKHMCDRYDAKPSEAIKHFICLAVSDLDWRMSFGFGATDDLVNMIERGLKDDTASMAVVASCLMSPQEQISFLKRNLDRPLALFAIPHMALKDEAMKQSTADVRRFILSTSLSL